MLSHLNEYNCDRYALFVTKDLDLLIRIPIKRTMILDKNVTTDPLSRGDLLQKIRNMGPWQLKLISDHPFYEKERAAALSLIHPHNISLLISMSITAKKY